MLIPLTVALIPTVVWGLIWMWIRPSGLVLAWLMVGMLIGALLGVPVWFAESIVENVADPSSRYSRDFIQQVLGAACCEELLKFVGAGILIWLTSGQPSNRSGRTAVMTLSVGIGFMTLENLVAVVASNAPLSLAIDRQMTTLAGHPGYQVVMGWCLARSMELRRWRWIVFALIAPIFLHGWGDLAEQLFQDDPDQFSIEDTILYYAWITSIVVTALVSIYLCVRIKSIDQPSVKLQIGQSLEGKQTSDG